jgi:amino-acid N-acetyltransferase
MLTDVRLRSAYPKDWPDVAALLERCGLPTADTSAIIESFHLAFSDGRLVGCAATEQHGCSILIRSVAVDPVCRGRGIASRLVEALLMRARGTTVRYAYLLSSSAPAYFARWGFSLIPMDKVEPEIRASASFQRGVRASALCMWCEIR